MTNIKDTYYCIDINWIDKRISDLNCQLTKLENSDKRTRNKVDNHLPIVECNHPYKKGEMFKNAFDLNSVSKTQTIKKYEWKLIEVKYKYKNK